MSDKNNNGILMATTGGMLAAFVVGYLIADKKPVNTDSEQANDEGGYNPPEPTNEALETTWEEIYTSGDLTVWRKGCSAGNAYSDGTNNLYYEYYIYVGNSDHSILIQEPIAGSNKTQPRVFSDENEAIAYVDAKNAPKEPTQPTTPEVEPSIPDNEEEDDGGFSIPNPPPFGGFQSPTFRMGNSYGGF